MANVIGTVSINQTKFLELDASPLLSPTPGAVVGDFCLVDGQSGVWQKTGPGDSEFVRVDLWTTFNTQATAGGTLTLVANSDAIRVFTGTTAGQIIKLPDATTLIKGFQYYFFNDSTQPITVTDSSSNTLYVIDASLRALVLLTDNTTADGLWTADFNSSVGLATQTTPGLMSAADKLKLDSIIPKAGVVPGASFTGNPKQASVVFTNPFPDNNYSVTFQGSEGRVIIPTLVTASGFTINTQANAAIVGNVYWTALYYCDLT